MPHLFQPLPTTPPARFVVIKKRRGSFVISDYHEKSTLYTVYLIICRRAASPIIYRVSCHPFPLHFSSFEYGSSICDGRGMGVYCREKTVLYRHVALVFGVARRKMGAEGRVVEVCQRVGELYRCMIPYIAPTAAPVNLLEEIGVIKTMPARWVRAFHIKFFCKVAPSSRNPPFCRP